MRKVLPAVLFLFGCGGSTPPATASAVSLCVASASASAASSAPAEPVTTRSFRSTAAPTASVAPGRITERVQRIQDEQADKGFYSIKIFGGEEDCANDSVAALLKNGTLHCSATLVGRRALLTAAHCVNGGGEQPLQAYFGCDANTPNGQKYKVVSTWVEPTYDSHTGKGDMGVVCIDGDPDIRPMLMPREPVPDGLLQSESLVFIGYGLSDASIGARVGVRRKVRMPVRQLDYFEFTYGGNARNTCFGDSGGPALLGNLVVGVTSSGDLSCRQIGVDTRTDRYLPAIRQALHTCVP